jgi:hypothetical protein
LQAKGLSPPHPVKRLGSAKVRVAERGDEEYWTYCGHNLVLKTGRFGEFTACGDYPKCKYVKRKTIGMKCPACGQGELVLDLRSAVFGPRIPPKRGLLAGAVQAPADC